MTDASALGLNHPLRLKTMVMSGSDLGMRRRRALWRATHRGSKEMDFLLGRFAAAALDGMNAAEIGVFERLIDTPDPDIDMSLFRGKSLGEADLDELIGRLRRFHRLEQAD
ncbi:MAG TPA: succinate dehydrogenase assembly factor 2 [Methyloceanibacter sp.]|nr:succinate dehydrogenase assembly factor 2 [Methyloceanibacter sp.]